MLESFQNADYLFQYISILTPTWQKQLAKEIIEIIEDNQNLQRQVLHLNNQINE